MKKLAVMFLMVFSLLAGSAFAAQERPNERGQGNRIHDRGMNDRGHGRRRHRRYRRAVRHHVIEHRGEGNHRPPTP